nr:MAG TPA: hypothetical protein [Caudoviricetes sp.]
MLDYLLDCEEHSGDFREFQAKEKRTDDLFLSSVR